MPDTAPPITPSLFLNGAPRKIQFRVWDGEKMRELNHAYREHYQLGWSTEHYVDLDCWSEDNRSEPLVVMQSTGLRTGSTVGKELYEGDIISFDIIGHAHGVEPDHCAAAHIWWCQEDGCWAFGRWVQTIPAPQSSNQESRTFLWWYTMMDDIDPSSITLLGNIFESPELMATLGYTPRL